LSTNPHKWHEYGETPTMFPEVWNSFECGDVYDSEYIQDWLKRCMEDFPVYPVVGRGDPWTPREYVAWFKKWFGQFREKGDI